uniref:Longin domain-containing protein n=1 Tax=Quercus lobata TaxID=97700 RepID=A0A7N2LLC9_QUELO
MVKLTLIARVTDGLPLAEGLDDGRDLKDGEFYKHYIIEGCVYYLTMCDHAYPKKLAFQYLENLKNEFERVNGAQIETAARPYTFIKFDTFIQKTKKLYQDTCTQWNIAKLNDELYEVHQIMTCNIQEVLGVGEKLDLLKEEAIIDTFTIVEIMLECNRYLSTRKEVSEMSSRLTSEPIYADNARDLN